MLHGAAVGRDGDWLAATLLASQVENARLQELVNQLDDGAGTGRDRGVDRRTASQLLATGR